MTNTQEALLYLTNLLVYSDGTYDDSERQAIQYICKQEGISENDYAGFIRDVAGLTEKGLYDRGIDLLEECNDEDRLGVFVWLYKLAEADGNIHAKEIRFLLYSIRKAGIEFDDVKQAAAALPPIPVAG